MLLALGAAACAKRGPATQAATSNRPPAARLGWRWIPGTTLVYRTEVQHHSPSVASTRAEIWSYTAVSLDPSGVIALSGSLVGLGATASRQGRALPEAALRRQLDEERDRAPTDIALQLRLNGRLVGLPEADFAATLPHRLLGMSLPVDPVSPGQAWDDPALAASVARLLPAELPVRVQARTRFAALEDGARSWVARLEHDATVFTTDNGPQIRLRGTCLWDTDPGAINWRDVEIRVTPDDRSAIGVLRATMAREDRGSAPPVGRLPHDGGGA